MFDGSFPHFENGALVRPYDFGTVRFLDIAGAIHWHLGDATRFKELLARYRPEDLAAEAQTVLEREVMNLVLPWLEKERSNTHDRL